MKRLGLLAAMAVTGLTQSARAVDLDTGSLQCGDEPTYYPRGDFWAVVRGTGAPTPVVYRIHAGGLDSITADYENQAIASAFAAWNDVTCDGATPNLRLQRGADYANRDNGDEYQGDALILDTVQNVVYFVIDAANWDVDTSILAYTNNLASEAGRIVTADMQINAINFTWRATSTGGQTGGCARPAAGAQSTCYDVKTTVLHEAGHFIGLNHVQCTDAVMYPTSTPSAQLTGLSIHERTGMCALYPPRVDNVDTPKFGESCDDEDSSLCATGLTCVLGPELPEASGYGVCTYLCDDDDDCPTAYVCDGEAGAQFCRPGLNGTGTIVDPAGECTPCTSQADCANGLCVSGADGGQGYCSSTCDENFPCPDGFSCENTNQGTSICWPDDPASCGINDTRAKLNEICYTEPEGEEGVYTACGTSLICTVFQGSSCATPVGACVFYCDPNSQSYSGQRCPDANQECCYGVKDDGSCNTIADDAHPQGGCFTIRKVGESCVSAENAICETNAKCLHGGDNSGASLCYRKCDTTACGAGETCVTATDSCGDDLAFCCDTEKYNDDGSCVPRGVNVKRALGVECSQASDCASGVCYNLNGKSACSRRCNTVTGAGCPGNIDVNGDAKADGGFYCAVESSGEGWCWMKEGPAAYLGSDDEEDDGGCSSTQADSSTLAALALVALVLRRRRVPRGAHTRSTG